MRVAFITYDDREQRKDYLNPNPYFGTAPAALLQGFQDLGESEFHVLSCTMKPMKSPERLAQNIWFHSLHVPNLGWMRTLYQGCTRTIRRKLRQIQPDLVHGQGTERYCALSAVVSGYPALMTIHGNMRLIAKLHRAPVLSFYWLAARLEAWTLPRADGVVCITEYTQKAVAPLNQRTWVVPNGVDKQFFDVCPKPTLGDRARILCVGLICPRKNQNELIRAMDSVAALEPIDLVFLGNVSKETHYGAEFETLVNQRSWCHHLGFADQEKLRSELSRSTMLILPSVEDNCPMVILEAMAAGVAVVASKVGGVPELITHGKDGILFEPTKLMEMIDSVNTLLHDAEKVKSIGQNAKAMAYRRFHPRQIAQRHLEIYREILRVNKKLTT